MAVVLREFWNSTTPNCPIPVRETPSLRCDSKLSLLWGGISRYNILNLDLMGSLLEAR